MNSAPNRRAAEPSAMHQGQSRSSRSSAACTAPAYTTPRACPQHTHARAVSVTISVVTGSGW